MIDWLHFSPWSSLAGGALIGLAAALFILVQGQVLGMSGILGRLLNSHDKLNHGWAVAFLLGMTSAPWLWLLLAAPDAQTLGLVDTKDTVLLMAGLLVGFGTRYGSGCTSGHSICGLARLSVRSLAATGLFITTGILTVWVTRHLLGGI